MKKVSKYILILLASLTLYANEAKSQIDTTFWFAAPWVSPDHNGNTPMTFRISTFGNATTVRIRIPERLPVPLDTTFSVAANTIVSFNMTPYVNDIESKPANTVLNTGIHINSDFPITVIYEFISLSNLNPETFSLKGNNSYGTEFVTPFQTMWNNQPYPNQPISLFSVVATEDNTTVYITPRCPVVGHPAGVTFSVFLPRKGNVYTCQNVTRLTSVPGSNLSGSIVVSDKPVAVTVSDDSVNPSGGGGCHDLMGDQIVPTDVIGKEYIVNKGFLNAGSNESIFVVATENFTTITIDNGITTTTALLNQGDTYNYSITQNLTHVIADKNVYLIHMSGYGCELGEAILPPLNCSGSDQVSFTRTNAEQFLLNILCHAGDEGSFTLNGSTTAVPASAFAPVPGTGGAWVGTQIDFTTATIPVGTASLITNSAGLFSMGVINGGASTGCLYHYLSSFLRRVITKAGNDTTLCNGNPLVHLNGSVQGGATTGMWTVLNGTGTLNTPTNLSTTYAPSTSDYAQGTLTFVLASTGNCEPVTDTVRIDFIQSPEVITGPDDTYCTNNVGTIPVSGLVNFAAGASWSGGSGGAFDNPGDLSTNYTPSPADMAADSVNLILTSAGSFFACPNDADTITIYFTQPPVVSAGSSYSICSNVTEVVLNGTVSGATSTGIWTTSGAGSFSPSELDLNATYNISSTDTAVGYITITLTSTGNGNCNAVADSITINILDKPNVTITNDDTTCANLATFNLTGTVSPGFNVTWSTPNGNGFILSPGSLNTVYNVSPLDTTNGFIDIILTTDNLTCPSEHDSIRLYFADQPRAFAGIDQAFCNNEVIQLTGSVTGGTTTGTWTSTGTGTFSPGSNFVSTTYIPSALDVSTGSLNLILTTTNNHGCNADDDTLEVTFKPSPTANFSNTVSCQGDNTGFTDLSTAPSGSINSWNWDFGDFTNSVASNPIHTYGSPGTFTVTLIAGSSNGCRDTIQRIITVNPLPVAEFMASTACEDTPVQFTDQSFISSGSIVSWSYTFGDGGTSTNANPQHVYPSTGSYPVVLQVTSTFGCTDTVLHFINVLSRPNADFTAVPNPVVALENVNFTDNSTGSSPLVDWYWNFGDSLGTNTQNAIHNYATGGRYPVTFIVTDANGCKDTATQEILVALLPVLPTAFTPNGDGENDIFIIRGGPFKATDFKVYNNWGQVIFSTNDALVGWDGTFKGVEQPLGVYTWTFEVQIADGRIIRKSGDVTLLR